MRKWNMMLLVMLLAALPSAGLAQVEGAAQELPELLSGVYESISEGLNQGAQLARHAMEQELTLSIHTDARIEEGKTARLTIEAGNPLPYEAAVRFALKLPQGVQAGGETAWDAVLPAAVFNEETGALEPSRSVIVREMTLLEGGKSAQAEIECEMAMGTRFYRAGAPLQLCVPVISTSAYADGTQDGRLNPGDAFAYRIVITNSGDAPKDMPLEMTLPETAVLAGELPEGFAQAGGALCGAVHVPAAQGDAPSEVEITLPAAIAENALENDEDAQRLIAPVVKLDGKQIAAPRIQVCGAKISARLMAERESLETGEETTLSVVVVNSGLAEADVQLSCVLPEGLTLANEEKRGEEKGGDDEEALVPAADGDDQLPGAGEAIPVEDAPVQSVMTQEDRTLVFNLHMDAASQTSDGVIAATRVLKIPVRAEIAQGRMTEQLLGASLAWREDEKPAQLAGAVALSVKPQTVLGLTRADWNGVFWAGVMLLVTVVCLYAAVKREKHEEDYCFE
ncbi:MAG: hypothetical protein IJ337_00125 [Clostridia bacterium]|nr:hypothetical protein [Clostridia bacterium]